MNRKNFILFNGPPRSGKDTAARFAYEHLATTPYTPRWEKFSLPHKIAFAALSGTTLDQWGDNPIYEPVKNEVILWLGVSYRQWQIDFSEKFMKPTYGEDIFARLLLHRSEASPFINVVSDCGFQVEVEALKGHNVLLFTMERYGTDFLGDSRDWVKPYRGWTHWVVRNNQSLEWMRERIDSSVKEWVERTLP